MTVIQCYFLKDFHKIELSDNHLMKLNDTQRTRIDSMSIKRKQEFYFSRQLLNFAMDKHCPDKHWQIIEQENSAPLIKINKNQNVSCSITHSPRWLGIAICTGKNPPKIGIDIETIRSDWSIKKAKLFCNDVQVNQAFDLTNIEERDYFLTKIWTQKEAYFKAGGEPVFNNNKELKENTNTPYSLISEPLSGDSIMSVYSEHNAVINQIQLAYLDGKLTPI